MLLEANEEGSGGAGGVDLLDPNGKDRADGRSGEEHCVARLHHHSDTPRAPNIDRAPGIVGGVTQCDRLRPTVGILLLCAHVILSASAAFLRAVRRSRSSLN